MFKEFLSSLYMKKIIFVTLLLTAMFSKAQELSYGVAIGGNQYEVYCDCGISSDEVGTSKIGLYFGGYIDYGFTDHIGAKALIAYNQKIMGGDIPVNFSFIDINPSFKYSFGKEYNKGFYLLLGPRFSFLLNAEFQNQEITDFFESSHIGLQLGMGATIYKFLELEIRFDYGVSALYEVMGKDREIFGGLLVLNLNLEKLINK